MIETIKKIITGYSERIVLGVVTIILIIVVLKTINSKEDEDVKRVNQTMVEIDEIIQKNKPLEFPKINQSEDLQQKWSSLDKPSEMESWVMYRPTVYVVAFRVPPKPDPKEIPVPVLKSLEPDPKQPDIVSITWGRDQTVKSKPTAVISGFKIYRKTKDEKEGQLLIELKTPIITPTDVSFFYTDAQNIQPETEYEYYITTLTDENKDDLKDGKTESSFSNTKKITTVDIVEVKPLVVNPDTNLIFMEIKKYFRKDKAQPGEWKTDRGDFKKGGRVGKGDFITNYEIKDYKEEEITKSIDPKSGKFITLKFFKVTFKNIKTGKEFIKDTSPIPK